MAEFNKIKVQLYPNMLTADNPNDYFGRVISENALGVHDISITAVKRGGADISAETMTHAVELWLKEMGYRGCSGFPVNTGWFTMHPVIRGSFSGPKDEFDCTKHHVVFYFHWGTLMREASKAIEVQIVGVADTALFISHVTDIKTGSVDRTLTPNKNLRINGGKIKIAGDNPLNGIYFINYDTKERTKVDESEIVINNPSELIIVIPSLASGSYQLEIVTQFSKHGINLLKDPHSTVFDIVLSVE